MSENGSKQFHKSESFQVFRKTFGRVFTVLIGIIIFYSAYTFGTDAFSNAAYDIDHPKDVTITVVKSDTAREVADKLEKNKLIYGSWRFRFRKYFSKYKDVSFVPGTYKLSQAQGMDDIMSILCGEQESKE